MTGKPMCVAAFVKTPGRSPLKTRLAAGIGASRAAEFYGLAVAATRAVLEEARRQGVADPCWAVAEAGAASAWTSLPVVMQGEGTLGDRLNHVYDALRARGNAVCLVGADAPAISVQHLVAARTRLDAGASYVLGPADDGGFYLFAGTAVIPANVWRDVPYSQATTARQLADALAPLGRVEWSEGLADVDEAADLVVLRRALSGAAQLLPAQRTLLEWLNVILL